MTFSDLIEVYSSFNLFISVLYDSNSFICGLFDFSQLLRAPIPNAAYIINAKDLNEIENIQVDSLNLIILGEKRELSRELNQHLLNAVFIQDCGDAPQLISLFDKRMTKEYLIHEAMKTLTNALFANKGTQYILNVAYNVIGNPLFTFEKGSGKMQFAANQSLLDSDQLLSSAIDKLSVNKFNSLEVISSNGMFNRETIHSLQECEDSMAFSKETNKKFNCDQLTSVIKAHGIEVGILVCLAKEKQFEEIDIEYFRRIATLLSQELQKKSIFTRNHGETKAQFLDFLLSYQGNKHELDYQIKNISKLINL